MPPGDASSGHGHNNGLLDAFETGEYLLYLLGLDVLPAGDEEVVPAAPNVQVTLLIQVPEVSGVEPAVRVERPVYRAVRDVAGEERLSPHQDLTFARDPDLAVGQRTAGGVQFFLRSAGRSGGDLGGHLREAVAGMDREPAVHGFVHEGGRHRATPEQDRLQPMPFETLLSQQPQELGRDEGDVRGVVASDNLAEQYIGLRQHHGRPGEQAPEEDGEPTDVVERQRVEP